MKNRAQSVAIGESITELRPASLRYFGRYGFWHSPARTAITPLFRSLREQHFLHYGGITPLFRSLREQHFLHYGGVFLRSIIRYGFRLSPARTAITPLFRSLREQHFLHYGGITPLFRSLREQHFLHYGGVFLRSVIRSVPRFSCARGALPPF